ncbi:beta-galactosidase [Paractinoplanes ferrugineus]|uniref:Beta-galactosidase n=1 Tax=Paractinoplanes ferrugineus TaxID=113564 RepID=A0A919MHG8_9ACTN|nr:beta-galactosidase [Actinoplanes ferrugineus]GIE15813.1 beta-galactosidase [Actinoplanes ferrugineus]
MAIYYGGDYNPEQWPEDVWREDVELMRRAGVNLATVGVFSWARIQPDEGVFDFGWLDRVLDLLHDGGVAVDLATATASTPPWATTRYPGILTTTREGAIRWPGSRQHYAPTSPDYRRLASALVSALVERYRDHPAVVMWHINNELGCHTTYDYSDGAAVAFRDWLTRRYTDIETLNNAWGTTFWSQRYTDFEQILPPRLTPAAVNPTQQLDFRRFSSDMLLELLRMEKKIIRDAGATQPITTNFMGAFGNADYWSWAGELDLISDDSYPDPRDPLSFRTAAFGRDLMRSLKPGVPWILMEQAPGQVNWRPNNAAKAPGQMAALSMQAVGRGADGVLFFQWRQAARGSEKFHSAMLPHAGPDTRTYKEVSALGLELSKLDPPPPGRDAKVALVLDWNCHWALDQPNHPARFDYIAQVRGWHSAFHELNVQVDIAPAEGPFDGYDLVVAPCLYLIRDAAPLVEYVTAGGALFTTAYTDVVDENDGFLPGGFTRRLGAALGLTVLDFAGVQGSEATYGNGHTGEILREELRLDGATVVESFADGPPALTHHTFGAGRTWHLATMAAPASRPALAAHLTSTLGIEPVLPDLPANVEACVRGTMLTLINHNPSAVRIGSEQLGPYEYRVRTA